MTLLDPHTLCCPTRMRVTQRALLVLLEAGPLTCQALGRHLWGSREACGERLWLPAGKIVRALSRRGLVCIRIRTFDRHAEVRLTSAGRQAARGLPRQSRLQF